MKFWKLTRKRFEVKSNPKYILNPTQGVLRIHEIGPLYPKSPIYTKARLNILGKARLRYILSIHPDYSLFWSEQLEVRYCTLSPTPISHTAVREGEISSHFGIIVLCHSWAPVTCTLKFLFFFLVLNFLQYLIPVVKKISSFDIRCGYGGLWIRVLGRWARGAGCRYREPIL